MRIDWWGMTDEALRAECEEDRFRASGPGGQHRNKTDSGVRLRHQPTGITVTATERRSQHENRARALSRLRAALAFDLRQPHPPIPPPAELAQLLVASRPIVSTKNVAFLPLAAYLLDVVDAAGGQVSTAAERVGISTARLLKQLGDPEEAWQALNRLRQRHDLPSLKR